jgi:DNA-binding response OmpR family regulator
MHVGKYVMTEDQDCSRMHALALTDDEELFEGVKRVLSHSRWQVHRAANLAEAARLLAEPPLRDKIAVALCGKSLSDGGWRDLVTRLRGTGSSANVVVVDRGANDSLWKDVLDGGGYDLVPFPLDPHELFRVVTQAWRQWNRHHLQHEAAKPLH